LERAARLHPYQTPGVARRLRSVALLQPGGRLLRAFVLYGQGGVLTSFGMNGLANQIAALGANVTRHNWDDTNNIIAAVKKLDPDEPVVLAGFSLGAGVLTWVSNALPKRRFDLLVAYDPSRWQQQHPPGPNVDRLLLYHNTQWDLWGNAKIPGRQVETTEVSTFHLAVQFDASLHAKTIEAIKRLT
jgi:pimeloyl-ACP methyl ester carboxylesterase